MEYVNYNDCLTFLEKSAKVDLDFLSQTLLGFIQQCIERSTKLDITDKVEAKYQSALEKIRKNNPQVSISRLDSIYGRICNNRMVVDVGPCHGDLTLSNVLVSPTKNKVSLIDFLDSFVDTPLVDLAKIRQDTKHGWSLLLAHEIIDENKIKICLDYIDKIVIGFLEEKDLYRECLLFQFLNLIRILQYDNGVLIAKRVVKEIECLIP
jgi:hypothetical protein